MMDRRTVMAEDPSGIAARAAVIPARQTVIRARPIVSDAPRVRIDGAFA